MIWVLFVFGLYVLALFGIAWLSLHPFRTPLFISPAALGQPQEEVEFQTSDRVVLRGWWTEVPGGNKVAVLAHGYVMNRCELTPLAVWLAQRGYSTLVFDFRAHGKSGGRKCGLGWTERHDVRSAVEFARSRVRGAEILLCGSSMGASACAFALAEDASLAEGLVLDSAYSRLPQAISGWWRFLGGQWLSYLLSPVLLVAGPLAGFNPFKVDVAKALRQVHAPVLIVQGDRDNLATPDEARRNEAACAGPVTVIWMPGCGHSEGRWVLADAFYAGISDFLKENALFPESISV